MKFLKYFKLQFKNAAKNLVRLFAVILALMFILSGVFATAFFLLKEEIKPLSVDVIVPPNDTVFSRLAAFCEGISGLNTFFRLEISSYEDAISRLENDDTDVVAVIPESFFEKAESMQDTRFELILKKEHERRADVFIASLGTLEKLMGETEASILTLYKGIELYGMPLERHEMEEEVLQKYVYTYIENDSTFAERYVSQYGDYSVFQYYLAAFVVIAAGFSLVMFFNIYNRENISFEKIYIRIRGRMQLLNLIKTAAVSIVISLLMAAILFLADQVCAGLSSNFVYATMDSYLKLFVVGFSMVIFMNFVGTLFDNAKRLIYVLMFMLMTICCGGVLPVVYLPECIRGIGGLLPFTYWHELVLSSFFNRGESGQIMELLVIDLIILFITMLAISFRENGFMIEKEHLA